MKIEFEISDKCVEMLTKAYNKDSFTDATFHTTWVRLQVLVEDFLYKVCPVYKSEYNTDSVQDKILEQDIMLLLEKAYPTLAGSQEVEDDYNV